MIFHEATAIRKKIQSVLDVKNGVRYAIVAFVGQDALDFIKNPADLTVYCWPNVAATHPDGLEHLISGGATVYFVDRMHVKLYWSESGGAVLGSSNLTRNALGGGANGLHELVYFVKDSDQVNIDVLLQIFKRKRQKVTDKVLKAYRRKYNAAAARRDEYVALPKEKKDKRPLPSFTDFLRRPHRRRWSVTFWGQRSKEDPRGVLDAVADYEDKEGFSKDPARYISGWVECDHKPQIGEWILCCRYGNDYGRLEWAYTHLAAKPRSNSRVWCATQVKKQVELPPFDCKDEQFVHAFHKFAKDLDAAESFVMTEARLANLVKHFSAR